MDLKYYAPKRRVTTRFALILAVACIVAIPLIYLGPTRIIPVAILLWVAIPFYPLPKALLVAAAWVLMLAAMYATAARIANGKSWKAEALRCIVAVAIICILADYAASIAGITFASG